MHIVPLNLLLFLLPSPQPQHASQPHDHQLPSPPSRWRKVLYVRQPYPDNYVHTSFLEQLQRNANVRPYQYWYLVKESCVVLQHLSSIIVFISLFYLMYEESWSPRALVGFGAASTLIGYAFWDTSCRRMDPAHRYSRRNTIKAGILLFGLLLGLTPILTTLTRDTSSDTIWSLSTLLFLLNALAHDYGSGPSSIELSSPDSSGSVSTNAAIMASVMLASRLPSNTHVFALIAFAIEWFALFPILRRHLRTLGSQYFIGVTILLLLACVILLSLIAPVAVTIYLLSAAFVAFICPWLLVSLQQYKNEIHGPWDEARPMLRGAEGPLQRERERKREKKKKKKRAEEGRG
ncbi:MAG: phosphatidylinositol N-acetylglucosaminyltransferase-domain-containing protein [Piptocephalis tieghemiana]|nr:MAG: phosphatidylinositol N-acetylglucosaminyltransferase-domain-containing protein [Piptocephalis tieghemiana]